MNDRQILRATAFSHRLPEKKYFKIGEVASLVGVEPHVLRYWETQFPQVRPHKARSGHRLYRRREVEVLLVIKELLHVQRFTIAGARQALRQPGVTQSLIPTAAGLGGDTQPPQSAEATLEDLEDEDLDELDDGSIAHVASVDVEGLDGEELALAMQQQAHDGRTAALVSVDLEVAPPRVNRAPAVGAGALGLSAAHAAHHRRQLEDALAEARSLLAFLDHADGRGAGRAL